MNPVEFRRHLHAHPELSFREHGTAAFIEQQLTELGIEHRRIASTGVLARIEGRKTPAGDRRAGLFLRLCFSSIYKKGIMKWPDWRGADSDEGKGREASNL